MYKQCMYMCDFQAGNILCNKQYVYVIFRPVIISTINFVSLMYFFNH